MKTKFIRKILAVFFAGFFCAFQAQSQTALSGTGQNTCGAATNGTDNTSVGCFAGANLSGTGSPSARNTLVGKSAGNALTHEYDPLILAIMQV